MGSISLAMALVAGMNRVPSPATGKTAFLIFITTPWIEAIKTVHSNGLSVYGKKGQFKYSLLYYLKAV
jgi:hypothetical protein